MPSKVSFEGKRELRWREISHCVVCYMEAEIEFADELWDQWMEAMGRPSITAVMICSWGPTQPSHQQWRRATRMMRDKQLAVAVVTEARHNLALAKAASWLGTNVSSHRWSQLGEACEFVGFDQERRLMTQATIVALRDRFGAVTDAVETGHDTTATQAVTGTAGPLFSASSELVFEHNKEIQEKLAEVQARFRERLAPSPD
ncbi:hypothetical protein [Enhygromyxa salina]|nr:hypothetical protein [Enhygromyxa salina]